ncbi:hypothetical protein, partial [Acidisphaera rubrifaciens]|uniref:hypothetical protein n=1 Tax=Acidisphaera rubrifaciens TaxID=50715 RepID=UPI000662390F
PAPAPARPHRDKAIVIAWLVECAAVTLGLVLSVVAGIEGSADGPATVAVAILPFAALSVIELTKIPLVRLTFRTDRLCWRILGALALVVVTAATFENFVFGFERGFNERIRAVEVAATRVDDLRRQAADAGAEVRDLDGQIARLQGELGRVQTDAAAARQQEQGDLADARNDDDSARLDGERQRLLAEQARADHEHDVALAAERRRCAAPSVSCRITAINKAYYHQHEAIGRRIESLDAEAAKARQARTDQEATARQQRDADLRAATARQAALSADLDRLTQRRAQARQTVTTAQDSLSDALRTRDALIDRSQLHRLADILYGNHEDAALQRTKRIFVVSLAVIVAVIGTVLATLYYAGQAAQGRRRRRPLVDALRALIARR